MQFKNTKGRLQIVFSCPIKGQGVVRRKRFYISTGYEDTPADRYRVVDMVKELQRDIDYGEVDVTLRKYQIEAAIANSQPAIAWDRSTQSLLGAIAVNSQ